MMMMALLAIVAHLAHTQQRPFTAVDLQLLRRLSGQVVSPDGQWVAYTIRQWDYPATNKTSTHIEIQNIKNRSAAPVVITPAKWGVTDFSPVFSPDGKNLAFLSSRSGSVQVWLVSIPNPDRVLQVTDYPVDVTNLKWPAKGDFFVFTTDVYVDCADLQCTANRDAAVAARGPNTGFVYDKLFVRHWDVWETGKISHIFVQSMLYDGVRMEVRGNPRDVMFGMSAESPITPFGGAEQFDISPDGTEIVFNADLVNREQAWSTGWRIYTVKVYGSQAPQWLTSQIVARTTNPAYSPDGSAISYLAMDRPGIESDRLHLEIYNRTTGAFIKVTDKWDRSIDDYSWKDNKNFFVVAADYGVEKLFTCSATASADVKVELSELIDNSAPTSIGAGQYLLQRHSYTKVFDIWTFSYNNGVQNLSQLTYSNKAFTTQFSLPEAELFFFTGSDNEKVQGFMIKPINFDPTKKYPVAHLIHGGPESPWTTAWSTRWNPALWASRGYAVVMINPAGSPGQGQAFTDAVRNDWGGRPFQDLMLGLDYILAQNPWMDVNRVAACGASYGGYMINWINGHTDRYKALVCHDGVFDTVSMYFSTEELWFPESEYCPIPDRGCKPWEKQFAEGFEKFNPRNFVQNWKTPTLVIHSSNDYRIPIAEGLSAFTALQRRGIPSRLLHFPLENHWVLNSANSVMWYDNVLGWLDQYTQ
jgi:dipeptidyl aminopeptidase/acylaminoacyl peptidase